MEIVTGATGFLGHYLVTALQERGDTVRALALPVEDTEWLKEHGVAIYVGDICQPDTLTAPMKGVDGVFHMAAMTRVWRSMEDYRAVNVGGTENVFKAARAAGVSRILHVSSGVVYGLGIGQPAREDLPLAPIDEPYSVTKAESDQLVQRLFADDGFPATIVRPGTVFGPEDSLNFGRLADRLGAGKGLIVGSGQNALTFVYVTDVIQGFLLAFDAERAVGEIYNIGNDQPLTQEQVMHAISEELGVDPPRRRLPYRALYSLAWASERAAILTDGRIQPLATRQGVKLYGTDNHLAIDKARSELGYSPQVDLREGIHLTANWYKQWRAQDGTGP